MSAPGIAARESAAPAAHGAFEAEADIVVVGGGGGGLPAALFSRWLGNDVILLEKAAELGGTAAKAAFWYWVPNNEAMRALGKEDRELEINLQDRPGFHGLELLLVSVAACSKRVIRGVARRLQGLRHTECLDVVPSAADNVFCLRMRGQPVGDGFLRAERAVSLRADQDRADVVVRDLEFGFDRVGEAEHQVFGGAGSGRGDGIAA